LTKDAVKAESHSLGVDAVLATRLTGAGKEDIYQPSSTSTMPSDYARSLDLYFYGSGAQSAYPGMYSKHYVVRLQTNVFDMDTEKLIWTASSQTVEPETIREIVESLCKNVMDRLQQDRLIR
jgi:hypothetical protein